MESKLTGDLPDIETYLKVQALSLHDHPPRKNLHHLGFLIQVEEDGMARWGELWTDEPLESPDQLAAWAVELTNQIDLTRCIALGFTYSFGFTSLQNRMCCLWRITPKYCFGEQCVSGMPWEPIPTVDKFAKTLWNLIK